MNTIQDFARVAVIGQGYVGLPLAVAVADAGATVVGIDASQARVDQLNSGVSPVSDVPDALLVRVAGAGRYRASTLFADVRGCDVVVLCVPTPYSNQAPDLSHVESAARQVGAHLSPGTLVILESTTYPGTTEEVLLPLLEAASGLTGGEDFDVAFSPERIDPGNPEYGIHNTPKIVGGIGPRATSRAADFYRLFVSRVIPVSSPAAAEMTKLLENTFRHINIALVNELAILARDMGIDMWEVIDAADSKPFGFMPFYPGPGVGGHCIPVDPMYLSWRVRQFGGAAKFIELARDINDAMPLYCATRIQDLLNDRGKALRGARVLIAGVAYKRDIGDIRESPALPLIVALMRKGAVVDFVDPHVDSLMLPDGQVLSAVDVDSALGEGVDCVAIVTPHRDLPYDRLLGVDLVFDTRNALKSDAPNVHRL
ncbi:MAG TPA: nucleotide sugar dehydrogenase [Acidimicrobiales bacterium]|nr:nucleotide sugar dehydrogenase [Acidimicrobiales bacterium]